MSVMEPVYIPENCPLCQTLLIEAGGIGHYCPNLECEMLDGPFDILDEGL